MKRNWLLELIYPWKCPFCGTILWKKEGEICSDCNKTLPYIKEPRCMKCGKPIKDEQQEFCHDCQKKKHIFCEGQSVWLHKEPVSAAIYRFKYNGLKCYGFAFGKVMANIFEKYLHDKKVELLIPIPLHKKRRRIRGYNQAEILAKIMSEYVNIPYDNVLVRTKYTDPQKQLDDKQRMKNIENAFELREPILARSVVLIDDIYTTGSTIDEAAKVLKKSGVSNVYFLTISIGQGF